MIRLAILTLFLLSLPVQGQAAIHLDQLSNCASLSALRATLRTMPTDCRRPRTEIERWFDRRSTKLSGLRFCFLNRPPSPALAAFDCMVTDTSASREITCIRRAAAEDLLDYRERYTEVFDPIVDQYLRQAATCPAGNGDASKGVGSVLPPPLTLVARHDLAFVLPVGERLRGSSLIVHGYAHADPEIISGPEPVIEYIDTWIKK